MCRVERSRRLVAIVYYQEHLLVFGKAKASFSRTPPPSGAGRSRKNRLTSLKISLSGLSESRRQERNIVLPTAFGNTRQVCQL
jgi:hypothetical protein